VQSFSRRFPAYSRRHQVLPGITGWAQVNGWRGDTSIEKRLEFDLYYIRNWSVFFNIWILLLTPLAVLVEQNEC
jgi:lipopolysaccharide/colanic/teichoic acid biosynthesis glycosyltransferase